MKLGLKNFQSIEKADFLFNPGEIVFLVGATNSGKTSVFRALQTALLLNSSDAASFIQEKNGEHAKELCVKMTDFENLPPIEFHREKDKAYYLIDGKKYSKLARSNLFEVYPELAKHFVYRPEDPRKVLNFFTEDDTAFPFDRSDTEMFKLFEKIFNITDSKSVLNTIKSDEDQCKFQLQMYSKEKLKVKETMETTAEVLKQVSIAELEKFKEKINKHTNNVCSLSVIVQKISSYAPYITAVSKLPNLESLDLLKINMLQNLYRDLVLCEQKYSFISSYTEIQLSSLQENVKQMERLQKTLSTISQIEALETKLAFEENRIPAIKKELEEVQAVLDTYKTCPLCGQELKGDAQS